MSRTARLLPLPLPSASPPLNTAARSKDRWRMMPSLSLLLCCRERAQPWLLHQSVSGRGCGGRARFECGVSPALPPCTAPALLPAGAVALPTVVPCWPAALPPRDHAWTDGRMYHGPERPQRPRAAEIAAFITRRKRPLDSRVRLEPRSIGRHAGPVASCQFAFAFAARICTRRAAAVRASELVCRVGTRRACFIVVTVRRASSRGAAVVDVPSLCLAAHDLRRERVYFRA
ncbi:hypothetical protein BD413DRAFT_294393 [Trametes elegans]|nr:hypothetical protein BD413DRAFT_294393 [Trametes elegans]